MGNHKDLHTSLPLQDLQPPLNITTLAEPSYELTLDLYEIATKSLLVYMLWGVALLQTESKLESKTLIDDTRHYNEP